MNTYAKFVPIIDVFDNGKIEIDFYSSYVATYDANTCIEVDDAEATAKATALLDRILGDGKIKASTKLRRLARYLDHGTLPVEGK